MKKTNLLFNIIATFLLVPLSTYAADAWPGDSGSTIATYSEPSGIVWHEARNSLFIVQDPPNSNVIELDINGNTLNTWYVGGDLEGITIANGDIYLAREYPQAIQKFDITSGTVTETNDISATMPGNSSSGMEALTYVDGIGFYAGSQYDGNIYVFDDSFNHINTIDGYYNSDLAGLFYNSETDTVYQSYDSNNRLVEIQTDGTVLNRYALPGANQEGVTLMPGCPSDITSLFIAEDSGDVKKYNSYPIICSEVIDPTLDDVVIVDTGSSGISYMQNALEGLYNVDLITMAELAIGVSNDYEILIFPGGADFLNYIDLGSLALNSGVQNSLSNFTGGIVGICGGSVVGSDQLQTEYYGYTINIDMADLAPVTAVDYESWYTNYVGGGVLDAFSPDALNFGDHYMLPESYMNGVHDVPYYGGPVFENYADVEVIATYTESISSPSYDIIGKPAIILKDNVLLSAVHPEYSNQDLFINMVQYVNGEIEEPEPDPEPIDVDGDGYDETVDCDDNNVAVNTEITYYQDADGDGLGSNVTTNVCSATAPSGYVINNNDANDNDFDNDGSEIGVDCDDSDSTLINWSTYYYDADGDGLGDANNSVTVCSLEVPANTTIDSSDTNDNDFDNDGVETALDCNDNDPSTSYNQTYYADVDGDGLGDINNSITVCSFEIPEGYVDNVDDVDDTDPNNGNEPEVEAYIDGLYIYVTKGDVTTRIQLFTKVQTATAISINDYYEDGVTEIIVATIRSKKTIGNIITLRVEDNTVSFRKRRKETFNSEQETVSIETDLDNHQFTTVYDEKSVDWLIKRGAWFVKL